MSPEICSMQYRLFDNLGLDDARKLNKDFRAALPLDAKDLVKGSIIDLPAPAAEYLTKRYPALLESVSKVKGVAKEPEIAGAK